MAQLLVPETGAASMLTNFGLLLPRTPGPEGGTKYELLCEETFGGKVPARVVRHSDGRLLIPGIEGLHVSADSCGFSRAEGSVQGRELTEVQVDPDDPMVIWALGNTPASLHVSRDGGLSFSQQQVFPAEIRASRLLLGPTGTRLIVIGGYTTSHPLALLSSTDGGATFVTQLVPREVFARPATVTELLGVLPTSPPALLIAAGSPQGPDQIWRSVDRGVSWTMTFSLRGMEVQSGFAQHVDGDQVFVAGRELFAEPGQPPAHLYRSRDGGQSFPEAIASGQDGPRYRCLELRGEQLYACAGEPGDSFLAGRSDDFGGSWMGLASLSDLDGRRACTESLCSSTAIWLCRFYGAACAGLGPFDGGSIDDAGRDTGGDGGTAVPSVSDRNDGCGCRIGTTQSSSLWALGVLAALAGRWAGRRRH